jgi:hypothetical protein
VRANPSLVTNYTPPSAVVSYLQSNIPYAPAGSAESFLTLTSAQKAALIAAIENDGVESMEAAVASVLSAIASGGSYVHNSHGKPGSGWDDNDCDTLAAVGVIAALFGNEICAFFCGVIFIHDCE